MTAQDIATLFESLELELVESLHRSLTRHQKQEQTEGGKNGTPQHWEAWQAAKLRDIRRFRRENTAILGEYRNRIDTGTRALLEEEAAQGGTDGFFRMDDTRMNALLNEMQQANEQSERAALRYMNDVYRKTILRTAAAMQAGGQTLQQATDAATRDFLEQGIACIRYRDGRRVNISTYAEMALRTAGTRAMLMGEAAQRERLGIDTVLVSQYGACSKTCLPWQGLVYIDDVFQQYSGPHTPGGTYGISRNGRQYPLLSVAMRGGLFHPNCRHTLSTWVEGTSTRPRPMDKARVEAVARLETRQRALERNVRKAKRRAAGLCDPDAIKAARASVRTAQKELRDFVADHGDVLRRDVWRERDVAGNGLHQKNRGKKVLITDIAIQKVPLVTPYGVDSQTALFIQDTHKELLTFAKEQNNSNEVACLIDLTTRARLNFVKGDQISVDVESSPEAYHWLRTKPSKSIMLCHNHPGQSYFSMQDIRKFLQYDSVSSMTVVTNQGKVWVISKTDKFESKAAYAKLIELSQRYGKDMDSIVDKFTRDGYNGIERL